MRKENGLIEDFGNMLERKMQIQETFKVKIRPRDQPDMSGKGKGRMKIKPRF